jgi:hypothetical protein
MMYSSIELGMEVETADGRVGQVVASPRGGKWLVACEDGRDRRYREEEISEYDREWYLAGEFRED